MKAYKKFFYVSLVFLIGSLVVNALLFSTLTKDRGGAILAFSDRQEVNEVLDIWEILGQKPRFKMSTKVGPRFMFVETHLVVSLTDSTIMKQLRYPIGGYSFVVDEPRIEIKKVKEYLLGAGYTFDDHPEIETGQESDSFIFFTTDLLPRLAFVIRKDSKYLIGNVESYIKEERFE